MEILKQVTLEKYARENGWELSDRLNDNAISISKAGINGFLLCANLDALFDKGLITFDDEGKIIISPKLTDNQIASLNLQNMRLRKIDPCHLPYLAYHRQNVFLKKATFKQPL